MDKSFYFGLLLGMLGGALIVNNSNKARQLVTDSQNEIKQKIDEIEKQTKSKLKTDKKSKSKTENE